MAPQPTPARVDAALLPPQLRAVVGLIGVADTLALLRLWGGQRRWLPRRPDDCPAELREALSAGALAALCGSDFAGRASDWPKPDKVLMQWRHQSMRRERAAGATAAELAARYGYTERRVRSVAPAEPAPDARQRDLFD